MNKFLPLIGAALLGAGFSIAVAPAAQAGPCDSPVDPNACSACIQANFDHSSVCVDAGAVPQQPSLFPDCDAFALPTERAICNDRHLIEG
jgi:hypothetical protein